MFLRRHPSRATRTAAPLLAVAAAFVATACVAAPGSSGVPGSAGPSASGQPTSSPTTSPSTTPSTTPSSSHSSAPSAFPSASPSTAPSSSGSGDLSASPSSAACGVASWARGPKDLVLRINLAGGFVAPGTDLGHVPNMSVYGDGTVITEGVHTMIYPGPLVATLVAEKLTPDGMRKLLDAAAAAGLLAPDVTYPSNGIADAPTTFFTLTADGCTHHVNAFALVEGTNNQGLDQATIDARAKLLAFFNASTDLSTMVGTTNVSDAGTYTPTAYRAVVRQEDAGTGQTGSPMPVVKWPLATPLAKFGKPLSEGMADISCGVIDGTDATTMAPLLAAANTETHWSSGGKTWYLMVRPLLPDESSCDAGV